MSALKVLFIGGTGRISTASARLAVERGLDVTVLNRGTTTTRPVPDGVTVIRGDIRDPESARAALRGRDFDAVVDWVAFTADHVRADVDLFGGRTGQYVFISSASAYQTPPARVPLVESTPLRNPFLQYSRDKIAGEDVLVQAYREHGFPATIVRPSHTYDHTHVPFAGGWTVVERMIRGQEVVVHGDGTSLWTLTHHTDFAKGFVPLLGHPRTVGDVFHLTGDDVLTWDQIAESLARAAGTTARIVHVPSETIAAEDPVWGRRCSATRPTRSCSTPRRSAASSPTSSPPCRSSRVRARSSGGTSPTRPAGWSTRRWTASSTGWSSASGSAERHRSG